MFSFLMEKQILEVPQLLTLENNFLPLENKKVLRKVGRIFMTDVSVNGSEYILINLCKAKTEKEQINVLSNMFVLLENFDIIYKNS